MNVTEKIRHYASGHLWLPVFAAGLAIGVAAGVFKWMIAGVSRLATWSFRNYTTNWWMILLGVCAIVLTGYVVRHVVRLPMEHATERMKKMIANGDGVLSRRLILAPLVTGAMTLGLGGSAGSEEPIAYSGAAIGSNMGRLFGLSGRQLVVAMACAAGAGIAAIFKAPMGGMFFTIEVLGMALGLQTVLQLAMMCIVATLAALLVSGDTPSMVLATPAPFELKYMPALLLLAVVAGLYSAFYLWSGMGVARRLRAIRRPAVRNLVAGLSIGVALFLFPALYGEGYDVLGHVANGSVASAVHGSLATLLHSDNATLVAGLAIAGFLLLKGMAADATNSGGGVAGSFAPTLVAGGMLGALFSLVAGIPMPLAVVTAMGAVMAGVVRAPLMAIFITVEMTRQQQLLLPVAVCAVVSLLVSRYILKE